MLAKSTIRVVLNVCLASGLMASLAMAQLRPEVHPLSSSGYPGDQYVHPLMDDVPSGVDFQAGDSFCDQNCPPSLPLAPMAPLDLGCLLGMPYWSAGVELTLLRPHFEDNVAFTTLDSDNATFETTTTTPFSYNRELSPRVWIEALNDDAFGMRVAWWNFDHNPETATGTPPESGFGRIGHPAFANVDLSTTTPGSQYIANSDLDATTIDLEAIKMVQLGATSLVTSFGLRHGEVEQTYRSELRSDADVLQGTIDFRQKTEGLGPTIALRTQRPISCQLSLFGMARGALIFGDGDRSLTAVEDLDLDAELQLTTNETSSRDDVVPIGELQVGLQWLPPTNGAWAPYIHIAMEGQLWGGVGSASDEDGNLGFYGFNVAVGFDF